MDAGYIICASCGARIKADREWCLRCEARLVPSRPPGMQLPAWLKAWGGGTLIFGAVGVLALALIGYMAWTSRSPDDTGVSRPAARPASTSANTNQSPGQTAPPVSMWSATSLD